MISEQISRLRKMQNKTQKDVSDYIGVSRAVVSDYERGRKKPSPDTLGKIATFFGVTTDYLLGRDGTKVTNDIDEVIEILNKLPEDKRKTTIDFIKTLRR